MKNEKDFERIFIDEKSSLFSNDDGLSKIPDGLELYYQ